jgi:hypothetical protein
MASLLEDPRLRQNWNHISHNVETATESAAAGIWTFTHDYLGPCFASISANFEQCTGACCSDREDRARRLRDRGRTRGRAEYSFDFYDDWDEDEAGASGGILGWGNDELDRLLAGSGSGSKSGDDQPRRKRGMSYGTGKSRRKNTIDGLPDPTIIPSTNTLGFLQRLPFKIGGTLRYKPSAADLQDHPGSHRVEREEEAEALLDDQYSEEDTSRDDDIRTRKRSSTTGSGDTSDSFRSRGDLFPSDGEDDAVPLSDEFAMVLERRATLSGPDDRSSGKTRTSKGKRPAGSRTMSRTVSRTTQDSSQSRPAPLTRGSSASSMHPVSSPAVESIPSLTDLQQEEERVRQEEEAEVEQKRVAATRLAAKRGLSINEESAPVIKLEAPAVQDVVEPPSGDGAEHTPTAEASKVPEAEFVPARLPNF